MTSSIPNQEQIEYWNEKAGPKWVAHQEQLDVQIAPFTEVVLERAGLKPGERVLDIGCGCGATTLAAAGRVGASGAVTGVDISRPMLDRARERARAQSLKNVTFTEGDAQTFDLGAHVYDAAISRFGVMFFSDPPAAFANIRKAITRGGRLAFICWRPMADNPWVTIPLAAALQHVEMPKPPDPNAPGPFAFADADRLRGILEKAGFADVRIDRNDFRMPIGADGTLENSVEFAMVLGPVSALLQDRPADVIANVRESLRAALSPHLTAKGVVLDSSTWMVSARNP